MGNSYLANTMLYNRREIKKKKYNLSYRKVIMGFTQNPDLGCNMEKFRQDKLISLGM